MLFPVGTRSSAAIVLASCQAVIGECHARLTLLATGLLLEQQVRRFGKGRTVELRWGSLKTAAGCSAKAAVADNKRCLKWLKWCSVSS